MHLSKSGVVHLELSVVAACEDGPVFRIHRDTPNPVLDFADSAQEHTISVPEGHLLVRAANSHVVGFWEETDGAGVESELLVLSDLLGLLGALDLEERQLLVPGADHKHIVAGVELLRLESDSPSWLVALVDDEHLCADLVSDENLTIEEADGQQLPIWGPVAAQASSWKLSLVDLVSLRHPDAEVTGRDRGETLEDWVEAQSLNAVVVGILADTVTVAGPDDHGLVFGT